MGTNLDIIIVGGGIAGLTAGLQSARLGLSCLVLTGEMPGGHLLSIGRIDGYPGFSDGVAGYDLCPGIQLEAADCGAAFAAASLETLEVGANGVVVSTGRDSYAAQAVILATGTRFRTLGVPGEDRLRGKGVSQCASCDAPLLRDRVVAVVGGGDSALQEALTLAEFAERVVIVHRGAALGGQQAYRARIAAHPKIEVRLGTAVEEIRGEEAVGAITLTDGDLEVAGVFIYIGLEPNTGPLRGLVGLDEAGHIPTGVSMATGLKGVFAAGTVRAGAAGRAAAAAGDGAAAAIAAARYLKSGVWEDLE